MTPSAIKAVLFDKDGTLFDFQKTWGAWANRMISELAGDDPSLAMQLADVMGFDRQNNLFLSHSAVIAGTGDEVADLLAPHLAHRNQDELSDQIAQAAAQVPQVEATPLAPLLTRLRDAGLKLGVATNDFEAVAYENLGALSSHFDFIAGFDSGFGGKPDPGMLLAFAERMGLPPRAVLMVGDSRHDLLAGRRAGMATLAVLTGVAKAEELSDIADEILPDIGRIPDLLKL